MSTKQNIKNPAFTLAEALIILLITSLLISAVMPVITKKTRIKPEIVYGKPEGWVCKKADSVCHFYPKKKFTNYVFYYNNDTTPSFASNNMGAVKIVFAKNNSCAKKRELPQSMDYYTKTSDKLSGTYCFSGSKVTIVY